MFNIRAASKIPMSDIKNRCVCEGTRKAITSYLTNYKYSFSKTDILLLRYKGKDIKSNIHPNIIQYNICTFIKSVRHVDYYKVIERSSQILDKKLI